MALFTNKKVTRLFAGKYKIQGIDELHYIILETAGQAMRDGSGWWVTVGSDLDWDGDHTAHFDTLKECKEYAFTLIDDFNSKDA